MGEVEINILQGSAVTQTMLGGLTRVVAAVVGQATVSGHSPDIFSHVFSSNLFFSTTFLS